MENKQNVLRAMNMTPYCAAQDGPNTARSLRRAIICTVNFEVNQERLEGFSVLAPIHNTE